MSRVTGVTAHWSTVFPIIQIGCISGLQPQIYQVFVLFPPATQFFVTLIFEFIEKILSFNENKGLQIVTG